MLHFIGDKNNTKNTRQLIRFLNTIVGNDLMMQKHLDTSFIILNERYYLHSKQYFQIIQKRFTISASTVQNAHYHWMKNLLTMQFFLVAREKNHIRKAFTACEENLWNHWSESYRIEYLYLKLAASFELTNTDLFCIQICSYLEKLQYD